MVGKQYGLKIIHKPSNAVKQEFRFNTEDGRNIAMGGIKLDQNYTFDIEEEEAKTARDAKPGE